MFQLKDFGVTKNVGVLKNGSKIFHFYKPNMPLSTSVMFNAGSGYDPKGKEGLAHFTEHILFKSTEKFRDETETGLFLESIGGQANAFTGVDYLGVTADIGVSSDYSKVVDFLHELTRKSLFEKDRIDIERGTILGEISDYESNPALHIRDLIQSQVFQGTYAERSIAGTSKTVLGISREDLYDFYRSRIVENNMSIVVAGDIEFEKILDLFEDKFSCDGSLKAEGAVEDLDYIRENPIAIKVYQDTDQIFIGFSFRTCRRVSEDSRVLDLLSTILGNGFSSSLFRKLRTESGLVYSLSVPSVTSIDRGHFSVVTSTSKDKLQKVLNILTEEFKRLELGNITEDEINLAKEKTVKSTVREMQDSGSWVGDHMYDAFYDSKDPEDIASYLNKIEKIKLEEAITVSKKYFSKDKWYLSLCGDVSEKDFEVNY